MKKALNILLVATLSLSSNVFGQTSDNFASQIKSYQDFISKPIHLPKWTTDVTIDATKHNSYLNYEFNKKNFYLDSNYTAWAGNWFAWENGGIAKRWKSTTKKFADKGELTKEFWSKVEKMSKTDIAELSPVEKFDIYTCGKGFEFFWATNQELIGRGPYKLPALDANGNPIPCGFCGFCNGARISGALMPEPTKEIIVKSKNHPEIEIIFYPADLKALAAAAFYYLEPENILNLGINYNDNLSASQNKLQTPNPAVLDIILREYLSDNKIPLFIDVQYNSEIWNETILGYDRLVKSVSNVAAGTFTNPDIKKSVLIECTLYCQDEVAIKEIDKKTTNIMANKLLAVSKGWVKARKYRYNLLIDQNGKIIDGIWVGSYLENNGAMAWTDKPIDFIWLGKGEGADSKHTYNSADPTTSNYTGNSNLSFNDILELFKLASKK